MASAHRGPDTTLLIFLLSQSDWNKIAMNSNLNLPRNIRFKILTVFGVIFIDIRRASTSYQPRLQDESQNTYQLMSVSFLISLLPFSHE